jgi:chromosome segregation ATPase
MRAMWPHLAVAIAVLLGAGAAQAQSETDRLRDALRSMTGQLRALEDQRAGLQARLAQTERERQRALQQAEQLRGQLKQAQEAQQQAVDDFNARIAERDATLEKWRTSYGQAAEVARERDAERAKYQADATAHEARAKSCEARNAQLLKVSNEILAGYRDLTLADRIAVGEPLLGFARVNHQNKVQEFRDRILDQDVKLPAPSADDKQKPDDKPATSADQKRADKPGRKSGVKKPEGATP